MLESMNLENIIKELHTISGFRISLYNLEREEIYAYPQSLSGFCRLIHENPKALSLCHHYDNEAFAQATETGEAYVYRCCFGLYEAVAPLYHYDVLSGYLMMGQTLDSLLSSQSYTYSAALPYIKNPSLLKNAIENIPIRSKEQILSCISIMEICAAYITLSNRLNTPAKDLPSQIEQYLRQHYQSKITLNQLCHTFYCSRATLTTSFRKMFHTSINEYLTKIRLEKAVTLLKNHSLSIEFVAEQCGFSDQNYFTKVFRKKYSITPSQYRKYGANFL